MTRYAKLFLTWTILLVLVISTIISSLNYFSSKDVAQGATLGIAASILILGLFGWFHFRIEYRQLFKGKSILSSEDIEFYGYDPLNEENEMKARKKKIFTFEAIMLISLVSALLNGIPALM